MSQNLMDTEIGGEQTQYEGVHTFVEPTAKEAGQLGDPTTGTSTQQPQAAKNEPNTQGITPADKIRYGQSIQEGGAGGKTSGMTGEASTEGGFGGTKAVDAQGDSAAKERRQQGYGGGRNQDTGIGG